MILPTQLSEPSLVVLRFFARSKSKRAGDLHSLAELVEAARLAEDDLESGLSELETIGLVECRGEGEIWVVLTALGERFFTSYHPSCHG